MGAERDLSQASRAELVALVLAQDVQLADLRKQIGQLQARLDELEGRRGAGPAKGMPGLSRKQAQPAEPKKERKKRARGFGRARQEPTERVIHAVEQCPECQTTLRGGWVQRRREVIELPEPVPVRVIEHVYLARQCPVCNQRRMPRPELDGVVLGRQRLGLNLLSQIATLREVGRVPLETIQWYLATFHQLTVSLGGLVAALRQVAQRAQPAVDRIRDAVRASRVVNGDETGWRENGRNGYWWTFSTPRLRYFLHGRRTKDMVDTALGAEFAGVLVTDFYAAYDHYPGVHQRCWAHLLRDIHTLKEQHPENQTVQTWGADVHALFRRAQAFASADEAARWSAQEAFERDLLRRCAPAFREPTAPHHTLCARIFKHIKSLFVFVADPAVPADNNGAERSLRHLVVCRKISGGTRSPEGTSTKLALASLFGTWAAQGLNPFHQCRLTLLSP